MAARATGGSDVIALLYHDVLAPGDPTSGFTGPGADHYHLSADTLSAHLALLVSLRAPLEGGRVALPTIGDPTAALCTFDDGGASAVRRTAPLLEAAGVRGAFFVPTRWMGTPGFATAAELRALHDRGHLIGTHTHTHPTRLNALPLSTIEEEWRTSRRRLEDAIGAAVTIGSVPAGFHGSRVARAAAAAGLTDLFTSEPNALVALAHGVRVRGRFSVTSWTPLAEVRDILAQDAWCLLRLRASWEARKVAKAVGGQAWFAARRWLLRLRSN
ncbi:MAG: polysaccharide deacetylase family protein [Gemmatimonadaceae bacterium]|jgi:peptidoglycan/xylan/chitin deacetylase (PgdA/CDA1 family)|nr:polysaccharide deacetylase family protein [Gemmatimonadaceae bacterium]